MKIIFLDVDGVLNSHRTYFGLGKIPYRCDEKNKPYFDWTAIGMIQRLVTDDPAIKIVLSSAWRIGQNAESLQQMGEFWGLPIIGATDTKGPLRGFEIQRWLDENPEIEHYVIIDDDADMLQSQAPHFVQTTFAEGMMYTHFKAMQAILDGRRLAGMYRRSCFWDDKRPCDQEEIDAYINKLAGYDCEGDI